MCPECHHMPSGRFDADGAQCYCGCHDVADAGPDLLAACERAATEMPRWLPDEISGLLVSVLNAAIVKAKRA